MDCIKTVVCLFVFLTLVEFHQCGRYGGSRGGSRISSGGRYHAPSYHAPSYSPPSYHSPSYHSPSYSPSYRARPSPPPRPPPSRPSPPAYEPPSRVATSRPVQSYRPGISTARPRYQPAGTSSRPRYPAGPTSRPQGYGSTRRPNFVGTTPRRHYTTARQAFNNLPPRPGSGPVGPPQHYGGSYSGPQKVKIVNKYNYHYPGYYSVPMAHYSHPGYFYTPSYYHYSSHDTGSTALGFFLGYSLAKITTPTYSHYSFYDGYRPRYDHYTVHHYYHNKDAVPQNQEIRANTIVGCVGDSTSICPANTTSLCTSNGALMCVASAISTVPCSDNRNVNCVTSTISCVNNTAPECKNSQGSTTISIPCVSKAEVYGDLKTVNNTIIPKNVTLGALPNNGTTTVNGTVAINTTVDASNNTVVPITQYIQTTPSSSQRRKRDVPQNFCVTIVALPAKRQQTAGEEFLGDAKFMAEKFIESAWNL